MINVKRLQVILDEMARWEQDVFEKEYADLNWFKGKQAKHVKEMEMGRKRSSLGKTLFQCFSAPGIDTLASFYSIDETSKRYLR